MGLVSGTFSWSKFRVEKLKKSPYRTQGAEIGLFVPVSIGNVPSGFRRACGAVAMFVEIGTFDAPKTVLCVGLRPDLGGVLINFLHSNRSNVEFVTEQIVGLTHHQLHLTLLDPPPNPVSPFLNLKRENVPTIVEWAEKLAESGSVHNERNRAGTKFSNIQVDIGTFDNPMTVSPIVFQPDNDAVSVDYLEGDGSFSAFGVPRVKHSRIAGLSYEQLLMAFKNPPPDSNSPFLNLKFENIPRVLEYISKRPQVAPHRHQGPLRVVGFSEAAKHPATSRFGSKVDHGRLDYNRHLPS